MNLFKKLQPSRNTLANLACILTHLLWLLIKTFYSRIIVIVMIPISVLTSIQRYTYYKVAQNISILQLNIL